MARVVWSERALASLEAALAYLEEDSAPLARRYARAIVDRVEQLETFPESGGLVPEDTTGVYRQLLQGPYRILYRVDGDKVLIVAIHHAARLLE